MQKNSISIITCSGLQVLEKYSRCNKKATTFIPTLPVGNTCTNFDIQICTEVTPSLKFQPFSCNARAVSKHWPAANVHKHWRDDIRLLKK